MLKHFSEVPSSEAAFVVETSWEKFLLGYSRSTTLPHMFLSVEICGYVGYTPIPEKCSF